MDLLTAVLDLLPPFTSWLSSNWLGLITAIAVSITAWLQWKSHQPEPPVFHVSLAMLPAQPGWYRLIGSVVNYGAHRLFIKEVKAVTKGVQLLPNDNSILKEPVYKAKLRELDALPSKRSIQMDLPVDEAPSLGTEQHVQRMPYALIPGDYQGKEIELDIVWMRRTGQQKRRVTRVRVLKIPVLGTEDN